MEGDDLTIPCNSKPKSGGRGVVLYWEILPRQFGTKKYPKRTLIQKYPGRKAYGLTIFGIKAKLVRNTHKLSIKNITRYAAATYRCTVVTLTTKSYAERTYFNVRVKGTRALACSEDRDVFAVEPLLPLFK